MAASILTLLLMVSCSHAPGQGTTHPTTLSAPVVGYTTTTPRSVVAYDDVVGDTILAFGDISAGLSPVLTLHLATTTAIPLNRYLLLEGHLPCTPGTIQPASLRLAFVFGLEFATPPGPRLTLLTHTASEFPDVHLAVLANTDGAIRGACDMIDALEPVDVVLQQGWNWVRIPPRIGYDEARFVAYLLADMVRGPPGATAVWGDLSSLSLDTLAGEALDVSAMSDRLRFSTVRDGQMTED